MKNHIKLFLLILLATITLTSCLSVISPDTDNHTLSVYMTDAVIPVDSIERLDVSISSIVLMSDDSTNLVISDTATTVNILNLIGTELELSSVETSGTYDQLRMYVEDATITVNGTEKELRISSGSLKIPLKDFNVNEDTSLMLDFDLSKSVKVQGKWNPDNISNVHMTPVIHARYGELYDISGTISDATTTYLVALIPDIASDEATVLTTFTHMESQDWNTGDFRFPKVGNGDYTIKVFDKETYTATDPVFDPVVSIPLTTLPVTVNRAAIDNILINLP